MPLNMNAMFDLHGRALNVQPAPKCWRRTSPTRIHLITRRATWFPRSHADAGNDMAMRTASGRHIQGGGRPGEVTPLYRNPDQPSLDGNTVDAQKENAAIAETAVRYQTTLTFLSSHIRGLRDAITGGR